MQGVNFSVADKIKIAEFLNSFGVDLIEGGWPGAIPKDTAFFEQSHNEHSNHNNSSHNKSYLDKLCAFGATIKPNASATDDAQLQALLKCGAKTVCIVAKSDLRHIEQALNTNEIENLRIVRESVEQIITNGQTAYVDAEHFFDGVKYNKQTAFKVVLQAFESGAKCVILCDTNGGCLPNEISEIITELITFLNGNGIEITNDAANDLHDGQNNSLPYLGIHAHNDTGCAVANTLSAVNAGVAHVQGTINEFGERTGNANLITVIADLMLKMNCATNVNLSKAYNIAHDIAEIANINVNPHFPYVGDVAFAHKAGLHASAIKVNPDLYQHIDPKCVGNDLKMLISEMAGRSSIELKASELGYDLRDNSEIIHKLTNQIKALEQFGYAFDSADASFELMLLREFNKVPDYFNVESWRVISETKNIMLSHNQSQNQSQNSQNVYESSIINSNSSSEATVKLTTGSRRVIATGEGNGPVNALDSALHSAIGDIYPEINDIRLTDYRVRLLDTSSGTDSVTRVLIESYDNVLNKTWSTVAVAENIVESSWKALLECYIYGLIQKNVSVKN